MRLEVLNAEALKKLEIKAGYTQSNEHFGKRAGQSYIDVLSLLLMLLVRHVVAPVLLPSCVNRYVQ